MRTVAIIPARLQSTRLPRKLLLAETGRTLLQHTWEAARAAASIDELIVATDSEEIAEVVRDFGGRAELTGEHPSGTDRVAEVVRRCCPDAEVVVNVQGDEPELDPKSIDTLIEAITYSPATPMATLATRIPTIAERDDPACVKVVIARDGRALYFSRAAIPFVRDPGTAPSPPREAISRDESRTTAAPPHPQPLPTRGEREQVAREQPGSSAEARFLPDDSPWMLHVGLYAYRRDFLLQLSTQPPSPLEKLEKLEQLRALEAGAEIRVALVDHRAVGIDTPEDYAHFVRRHGSRAA